MAPSDTVPCPTCGKPPPPGVVHLPFCSERCKMVDLGRWFRGEYVVAGEAAIAFDPDLFEGDVGTPNDGGGSSEPEA